MTMPVLIANYQKKVVVTRLERSYNTFVNILVRAQVDYGDSSKWDYEGAGIELDGSDENKNSAYNSTANCVRKYILPYLADGYTFNDKTDKSLNEYGYTSDILYRDGTNAVSLTGKIPPILILNDGTWMFFSNLAATKEDSKNSKVNRGILIFVDTNGPKAPNTIGKDVHIMVIYFAKNSRLSFYRPGSYLPSEDSVTFKDKTREELLEGCKTTGKVCGTLIQADGWQIKDDYPW